MPETTGSSLFVSLIVSVVGYSVFLYGKKQARMPQLVVGLVLMIYPYLVPGFLWMSIIGCLLVVALWGATRAGF